MGALDFLLPILNKALEVNMDDHVSEHMCWALRYLAENLEAEKFGPVIAPVFIHTAGLLYKGQSGLMLETLPNLLKEFFLG